MPSSEDMLNAQERVNGWARAQLKKEGYDDASAKEILRWMPYEEKVKKAEKFIGKSIYRGPYSAY